MAMCTICASSRHAAYACPQRDRRCLVQVSARPTSDIGRVGETRNGRHIGGLQEAICANQRVAPPALGVHDLKGSISHGHVDDR